MGQDYKPFPNHRERGCLEKSEHLNFIYMLNECLKPNERQLIILSSPADLVVCTQIGTSHEASIPVWVFSIFMAGFLDSFCLIFPLRYGVFSWVVVIDLSTVIGEYPIPLSVRPSQKFVCNGSRERAIIDPLVSKQPPGPKSCQLLRPGPKSC